MRENNDQESDKEKKKRLTVRLSLLFVLALVMGPGPGAYLVNPNGVFTCLGFPVPALYAWLVLWFGVMAVIIFTASLRLWGRDEDITSQGEEDGE